MSKRWLFAAAAALSCTLAFGQNATVILDNQEDSAFYYVVDPPALAGLTPGSPLLASKVSGYLSAPEAGVPFASIPPQTQARITNLAPGYHLLVGFFTVADANDLPVRVMSLQADEAGERYYTLYASPAQLSAHRGLGKLAQLPQGVGTTTAASASSGAGAQPSAAAGPGAQASAGQAGVQSPANQAGAPAASESGTSTSSGIAAVSSSTDQGPESVPVLASFSPSYDPGVFTRETKDDFKVLPIGESRSWNQAGTRIASVRGSLDARGLRIVLNVPGGFSPWVSYFLYVFAQRSAGMDNTLTLEIEPLARSTRGACILWVKGAAPRILGTVTTGDGTVQLDVQGEDLAALAPAGDAPSVDLTAGWYDKALGTWEEFYYTTLSPTR